MNVTTLFALIFAIIPPQEQNKAQSAILEEVYSTVIRSAGRITFPKIAVDAKSGTTLVSWSERPVKAAGPEALGLFRFTWNRKGKMYRSKPWIAVAEGSRPALVNNPDSGTFLLAWCDYRSDYSDGSYIGARATNLDTKGGFANGAVTFQASGSSVHSPLSLYCPDSKDYLTIFWRNGSTSSASSGTIVCRLNANGFQYAPDNQILPIISHDGVNWITLQLAGSYNNKSQMFHVIMNRNGYGLDNVWKEQVYLLTINRYGFLVRSTRLSSDGFERDYFPPYAGISGESSADEKSHLVSWSDSYATLKLAKIAPDGSIMKMAPPIKVQWFGSGSALARDPERDYCVLIYEQRNTIILSMRDNKLVERYSTLVDAGDGSGVGIDVQWNPVSKLFIIASVFNSYSGNESLKVTMYRYK